MYKHKVNKIVVCHCFFIYTFPVKNSILKAQFVVKCLQNSMFDCNKTG